MAPKAAPEFTFDAASATRSRSLAVAVRPVGLFGEIIVTSETVSSRGGDDLVGGKGVGPRYRKDLPPDHGREAVHHLEGGHGKEKAPTGRQIGPEYAIQCLVRTGRHDDTGRIHSEALGDVGLQGSDVRVIPDPGQVRRRQVLEEPAGWRIPLVAVEFEHPGLRQGRPLVEVPGDPGRRER